MVIFEQPDKIAWSGYCSITRISIQISVFYLCQLNKV